MKKKIEISGMNCGNCAMRIEKALGKLPGVNSVKVDLIGKFAEVDTSVELKDTDIKDAVDSVGFQVIQSK